MLMERASCSYIDFGNDERVMKAASLSIPPPLEEIE